MQRAGRGLPVKNHRRNTDALQTLYRSRNQYFIKGLYYFRDDSEKSPAPLENFRVRKLQLCPDNQSLSRVTKSASTPAPVITTRPGPPDT